MFPCPDASSPHPAGVGPVCAVGGQQEEGLAAAHPRVLQGGEPKGVCPAGRVGSRQAEEDGGPAAVQPVCGQHAHSGLQFWDFFCICPHIDISYLH